MKLKILITTLVICSFTIKAEDKKSFTVNPDSIRTQLIDNNTNLLMSLNNVQNSKLNVTVARNKLLPSLNLGVFLPGLANPSFLLGSVSVLFPFLVPSNWATLKQQTELYEADKIAYKTLQLNIYSNALSLYQTYLSDLKVQKIYADQSALLGQMYKNLKKQSDVLGNIPVEDLEMANAQLSEAKLKISKLDELLIDEKAALRTMLGLDLGTELLIEDIRIKNSEFENKTIYEVADEAMKNAPEFKQIEFLIKAAEANKFSKQFGFISNGTMSGSTTTNSTSVFDTLKIGSSFNFGLDIIPNIKIAENNIAAIYLRKTQLTDENERVSEVVINKIKEIKEQVEFANRAYQSRLKVFNGQKKQYDLGLVSLQSLLQSESQLTDSKVSMLKVDFDLVSQSLTVNRLIIDNEFKNIKGCVSDNNFSESKKLFGGLKRDKEQSLDSICSARK